jgi:hypothetical protein
VVWSGARAACAEVSTESVEASKARLGFKSHVVPKETHGSRSIIFIIIIIIILLF